MSRLRVALTARPWRVDLAVTLLVQAAVTIPFVVPRAPHLPEADWASYALTTLAVAPLPWRRRAPVAVLLAVLAAGALYRFGADGPGQPLPYPGLVAFYTVAALSPPPRRLAAAALMFTVIFPSVATNTGEPRELLFSLFVFGAAYVMGRLTDTRQRYAAAMAERAAHLERANRVEAEQAAARERARIAREMHDVLSHAVSLMVVQAEAGPVAVRTAPERAEAAFEAIAEAGRDAMTQLRGMLGVLREGAPGGGPGDAPRAPQPGPADLAALLERVRGTGLAVVHETAGPVHALPTAAGTTAYRVVQEALTNTVRHAGATTAVVRLVYDAGGLEITVTDDGRGAPPAGTGGGNGLTGLRERAAAHGGTAEAGTGPGGRGFVLRVALPVAGPSVGVAG
ncbi:MULTISPECIES: sensor histidine kinase [unclassified Streptomyces]|uniref:sensor histidine kinase n=1 Tax=unclassified Streptomyces TaxID=2593676 RepID=UPI001D03E266|nr:MULTISPECIES: histidine kinase [unclassified Streptomyces]